VQGWDAPRLTPAVVSSTVPVNTPMPHTSEPSVIGNTTASRPSWRSPKLRRQCPKWLYAFAAGDDSFISSSVKVFVGCPTFCG
jgi:hypothetical protein